MKLLFKQRLFSWFDSYDIYNENEEIVYTVEGKLSWGHKRVISDIYGCEIGMIKEEVLTFLPRFALYINGNKIGQIKKEFSFFAPSFKLDCMEWTVKGNFLEWDYSITDNLGNEIAVISKKIFSWTDTYIIDINDSKNAVFVLMIVLAIDAAKCSSSD